MGVGVGVGVGVGAGLLFPVKRLKGTRLLGGGGGGGGNRQVAIETTGYEKRVKDKNRGKTCGASSGCEPAFRAKALAPEEAMHTSNAVSHSSKGKKGIMRRFGDTRMMRLGF
jgi:hypothetical protein